MRTKDPATRWGKKEKRFFVCPKLLSQWRSRSTSFQERRFERGGGEKGHTPDVRGMVRKEILLIE